MGWSEESSNQLSEEDRIGLALIRQRTPLSVPVLSRKSDKDHDPNTPLSLPILEDQSRDRAGIIQPETASASSLADVDRPLSPLRRSNLRQIVRSLRSLQASADRMLESLEKLIDLD